jgi:hypothetical protein
MEMDCRILIWLSDDKDRALSSLDIGSMRTTQEKAEETRKALVSLLVPVYPKVAKVTSKIICEFTEKTEVSKVL